MDIEKARSLIQQSIACSQDALAALDDSPTPPTPSDEITVPAGTSLQAAIDAAPDGATLLVEPGTFEERITVAKPLTIKPTIAVVDGRATAVSPTVWLTSSGPTVTISGSHVNLTGLGVQSTNCDQDLLVDVGDHTVLDRCVLLGDPIKGQHRGIQAHGGNCQYLQCYVDNCFLPGRDAQALSGWDGTNGLLVDDCYLGGGAQSIMFGGADPSDESRTPRNVLIKRSTLSKSPDWYACGAQIKCALELKNCLDFAIEDCVLDYAGISGGSTGYSILFTPRNQNNSAPYSSVQRVRVERCLCRYAGGGANLLGSDDANPSGPLSDVVFYNVEFRDMDPSAECGGQGRVFLLNSGNAHAVANVTIDSVTASGVNMKAGLYVIKAPSGLIVRNLVLPETKYGDVKIDGGGSGWDALLELAPDTVVDLTDDDTGASGVPEV